MNEFDSPLGADDAPIAAPNAQSRPRQAKRRNLAIAVASGKGGVGKTWMSITLAEALTQSGASVLLFDGDLGLANVNIQLGVSARYDIVDVVNRRQSLDRAAIVTPGGMHVLSGRSGSTALSRLDGRDFAQLCAALTAHRSRHDYLILDTAAGVGRHVIELCALADLLLVVVTEEPTSLTDAYALIKTIVRLPQQPELRIVVNAADRCDRLSNAYKTLLTTCSRFLNVEPPLFGVIPKDRRVPEAIRRQQTLAARHRDSSALRAVQRLAQAIHSGDFASRNAASRP